MRPGRIHKNKLANFFPEFSLAFQSFIKFFLQNFLLPLAKTSAHYFGLSSAVKGFLRLFKTLLTIYILF